MKFIFNVIASYITTFILVIIYLLVTAIATFIENSYGTPAAKYWVYNATYFNLLHLLLILNMLAVSYKEKLYNKRKLTIFIFHFGFIIVILGAAITRFYGYAGNMHIREGAMSNIITTTNNYLTINMDNGDFVLNEEIPIQNNYFSSDFSRKIDFIDKEYTIKLKNFIPNAVQKVTRDDNGVPIVSFLFRTQNSQKVFMLAKGKTEFYFNNYFAFDEKADPNFFNFRYINDSLFFSFNKRVKLFSMSGTFIGMIPPDSLTLLNSGLLYQWENNTLILNSFIPKGKITIESDENKSNNDALIFDFTGRQQTKEVIVWGTGGNKGKPSIFKIENNLCSVSYGSKEIELPFSLKLNDFQLERYPGSMSPKSYRSDVSVIDPNNSSQKDYLISMNKVLDYHGFRFFQSSYDTDERGTILSVNHDFLGSFFTYIGYALLAIGMFLSLFNKHSRLHYLSKKLNAKTNKVPLLLIFFFVSTISFSQNSVQIIKIDKSHAEKFGSLYIKGGTDRVEPITTFTSEILLKLTHKSSFLGMNPNQVYLSMLTNQADWFKLPIIKVSDPSLVKRFNAQNNLISMNDLFNNDGSYVLNREVNAAYQKSPATRNEFDKEIIKIDERANVLYRTLNHSNFKIIPDKSTGNWNTPMVTQNDSNITLPNKLFSDYILSLKKSSDSNNWQLADSALKKLAEYQKNNMNKDLINENKKKAEIFYYKAAIFRHLFEFYFTIGLIYVAFLFFKILFVKIRLRWLDYFIRITLYLAFIIHTFGLGLRWYISNHAPWSNGYESMIYIAWATLLSGIIFSKKNKLVLAATTVLSGITLLVAHLSWMDPQITNLVPVLQSYWLTIHVAIITASYGFLGLCAILGLLILVLMIFVSPKNKERIAINIRDLSYINEMSLIVGLYLLSIGTFLGGIWANQSWGTYWSWDPKETWSLISILVYTLVLHTRLIPPLRSVFSFNLLSLLSISSIIMTFFGVNYYLSGMHSYGKGGGHPGIPSFVYYSLIIVFIISILSFNKYKKFLIDSKYLKS